MKRSTVSVKRIFYKSFYKRRLVTKNKTSEALIHQGARVLHSKKMFLLPILITCLLVVRVYSYSSNTCSSVSNGGIPGWTDATTILNGETVPLTLTACSDDSQCSSDVCSFYCRYYPVDALRKTGIAKLYTGSFDYQHPLNSFPRDIWNFLKVNRVCVPFEHTCDLGDDDACNIQPTFPTITGKCKVASSHGDFTVNPTDCAYDNEPLTDDECADGFRMVWIQPIRKNMCIPMALALDNQIAQIDLIGSAYETQTTIGTRQTRIKDLIPECKIDLDCMTLSAPGDSCKLQWFSDTPDPINQQLTQNFNFFTDTTTGWDHKTYDATSVNPLYSIENVAEYLFLQKDTVFKYPFRDNQAPGKPNIRIEDMCMNQPFHDVNNLYGAAHLMSSYKTNQYLLEFTGNWGLDNNEYYGNRKWTGVCTFIEDLKARRCVHSDTLEFAFNRWATGNDHRMRIDYTGSAGVYIVSPPDYPSNQGTNRGIYPPASVGPDLSNAFNQAYILGKLLNMNWDNEERIDSTNMGWFGAGVSLADSGLLCRMDSYLGYRTCTRKQNVCGVVDSDGVMTPQDSKCPSSTMTCRIRSHTGGPPNYIDQSKMYGDCFRPNECITDTECQSNWKCSRQTFYNVTAVSTFTRLNETTVFKSPYPTCSCQAGVGTCVDNYKVTTRYPDFFTLHAPKLDLYANVQTCDPLHRNDGCNGGKCYLLPENTFATCNECPTAVGIAASAFDCTPLNIDCGVGSTYVTTTGDTVKDGQHMAYLDNTKNPAQINCKCNRPTDKDEIGYCTPYSYDGTTLCGEEGAVYNYNTKSCDCGRSIISSVLDAATGMCKRSCPAWTTSSATNIHDIPNNLVCGGDGRGTCVQRNDTSHNYLGSECVCNMGYAGYECSHVLCPVGVAGTLCSGNGVCDAANTGRCLCFDGFVGFACEQQYAANVAQVLPYY